MKKLFIPYELAVIAKEKGFDEPCIAYYANINKVHYFTEINKEDMKCQINSDVSGAYVTSPLYQQIVDWFETFDIDIEKPKKCALGFLPHVYKDEICKWQGDYYETKYEALNKAIEEAFKLI